MFNEKVIDMNHFFKTLFLTLAFPCLFSTGLSAGAMGLQRGPASQQSVHDMFKDLTEDEIVALMEEGQREMTRIMTEASPEEQEAFMKMMEETMQNFSEEDFAEINKIAKVVEPILLEKEAEAFKAEAVKAEPVKAEVKKEIVSGDSSFEYMLHKINKTINGILLKVKSDTTLTEILKNWSKKDDFNELTRLLQALNTKHLISKLTTVKTDDIKKLVETIENFNKRLEIENKQFAVADTFGLEVDKETSTENSKKFYKILEFFAGSTETLLPMIVKFLQEFEPEALKLVKAHDDKAKASLDAAKQIEKQKRPIGSYIGSDNNPSNGSSGASAGYNQQNNYNPSRNDYGSGQNYSGSSAQNRRNQNKMNSQGYDDNSSPKTGAADKDVKKEADKSDKKEADKKSVDALKPVIDKIERFDDMFDNNAYDDYRKALIKAGETYTAFGKELPTAITEDDYETILQPEFRGPLTPAQSALKNKFQAKAFEFGSSTKKAHTHYGELKASIENIKPQILELKSIVDATRTSLPSLSIQELEKLGMSPALQKLKSRFNSYKATFDNVQKELKNKHKAHKLEHRDHDETKAYNDLEAKVESLHGLDTIISSTHAALDTLDRAIKAEIKLRKRDASKRV